MKVGITVLVENTVLVPGLLAEHGLAYWIELDSKTVLFDTGQGLVLTGNAYKLKIPLHQVDKIVLSHGHYDHTGGLTESARNHPACEVFAHPAAVEPKFARSEGGQWRDIGMPFAATQVLREGRLPWVRTDSPTRVLDGLMVTGPIERATDFEDTGGPFFLDREGRRRDPLIDDQALLFDTDDGLVVLLGCAHAGVINTLRAARSLTGNRPINTVLGGMHLLRASPKRVRETIAELRQLDIARLGPAHCTGSDAVAALWHAFPGRCVGCHVGARFEFEMR